jgi:hypothetical protein
MAHSSSDRAPRARPPCGLRWKTVHQPACAQRVPRSRLQPGPGPGKSLPTWAETRSGDREPSISIQRLREVSGGTKPRSTPSRNPSPHSDFLRSHSRAAAQPSNSVGRRARAEGARPRHRLEPLAGVRAHRWVDAPPSSGLNGVSSRLLAPTR